VQQWAGHVNNWSLWLIVPPVGFDRGVQALGHGRAAVRSRPVVEKETRGGHRV